MENNTTVRLTPEQIEMTLEALESYYYMCIEDSEHRWKADKIMSTETQFVDAIRFLKEENSDE